MREEGVYKVAYTDDTWVNTRHTVSRVSKLEFMIVRILWRKYQMK